ncbi:MAG: LTA synthase family protein [Oscillospiraceae bacterium]|nr:LTA synthase family protein [Oscillospiraceae bacterium]
MKNWFKIEKARINPWVFAAILPLSIIAGVLYWIRKMCAGATFESVMFTAREGLSGLSGGVASTFVSEVLLNTFIFAVVAAILVYLLSKIVLIFKEREFSISKTIWQFCLVLILFLIFFVNDAAFYITSYSEYTKAERVLSTFIEDNYIDPSSVKIEFPSKKRNLIFIHLESIEATFADKENGGNVPHNLIPELTNLAKQNISFSNTDKLGGAIFEKGRKALGGMGWTAAGLVSQTAGLPLKQTESKPWDLDASVYYPKAITMGEILSGQGYNQIFMCGSEASYGKRDSYYEKQGVEIKDLLTAREEGFVTEKYHSGFWGLEDKKLFEYAKQEITKLAKKDEPFAFQVLTVDTHFPNGWQDENTIKSFGNDYENAVATSSRQVAQFVEWIKEQDFFDDTTIVLTGDHLSMTSWVRELGWGKDKYIRTTYNAFINSAVKTEYTINREFTNLDMFPTILASMGAKISGNRLGLGVNLFSGEKTLLEEYGFDFLLEELAKTSEFLNYKFSR